MADIDLGALKYKIGLDTSGLEKQLKETEDKLKDSVSQQLSFKVAATELSGVNNQLGEMLKKILEANKQSAKIGSTGKKELPIEKQIDRLSKKLNSAAAKYEILRAKQNAVFESGANDSSVKKMDKQLEHMSKNIKKMQAEYIRLNDVFKNRQVEMPQASIASERELNLLRRQYELEQARTKELAKQAAERERANRKIQADQSKYLTYLSGQSGLAIGMPEGDANEISKKIAAIETRIKALNSFKTELKINSNQAVKADAVIAKLQDRMSQLQSSMKRHSTADLLNINPTSINQANALIAELTSRRNALNVTDAKYTQTLEQLNARIREHNQFISTAQQAGVQLERTNANNAESSKKFSGELEKQNRMMREFVNTIKTYAGFYFFRDMFQELVRIRGEFELQQVSLRAIIQDARRADQIFQQIKGLAVVSPFQFKDLVGYTKQLSAFQIPVNELYGTMKSLADVSAGLGVDMGRIILAYGQIRSAGVLRGQELRQLTEAGIPALEQLRKKLEQVRGVAVTTDDVFTAISKREIPFEYIKEMFTTMTEEGGAFYKMQEIQASSLKGMVSNLADSYQLMMNDVGEANDSVLKGIVSSITDLMNNWRYLSKAMEGVLIGYGALKLLSLARVAILGKEARAIGTSVGAERAKAVQAKLTAYTYQTLTREERLRVASIDRVTNADIRAMIASQGFNKEMAKRILLTANLTKQQRQLLVTYLGLQGAERANMLNMGQATLWMNRLRFVGNRLVGMFKALWLTIKANPFTIFLTVAGLVAEAFHVMSVKAEEFKQKMDETASAFRQAYSDLQKELDLMNFDKLSTENLGKLDNKQLESYETTLNGILAKFGNIGLIILQNSRKIDDQTKRIEYLQNQAASLEESYKVAAENAGVFLEADKASDIGLFGESLTEALSDFEDLSVKLTSAGKNVEEFRGQIVTAAQDLINVEKGTKQWREELEELIKKGASASTIIEKIRSLNETDGGQTFQMFKYKTHFDSREVLKEYDKLKQGIEEENKELDKTFAFFANSVERRLKGIWGNIDVKNLTAAQQNYIKLEAENLATANKLGLNAQKKLFELVSQRWSVDLTLDDEEAVEGLTGWKKSLDEITGKAWTITIKTSDVKTVEDFFDSVKNEYKEAKESVDNLQNTMDMYSSQGKVKNVNGKYQITEIVGPEERETISKIADEFNYANESMSKATTTAKQFNLELEKQKADKKGRDPLADLWKNRLALLDSAYAKFKDLSITIGKEEAKKQIDSIYGSQAIELGVKLLYDKKDIANEYEKAASELEKRVPQDAAKYSKEAAEKSSEVYIESFNRALKQMTQDFERYRNKYDFYKDILGITGDTDLALDLAIQYTGDTSQMAENFAGAIYANLQRAMSGMNLNLGIDIVPDTNSFTSMNDYVNAIINAVHKNDNIGETQKEKLIELANVWKDYFGNLAKQYAQNIADYGDYYNQMRAIQAKYTNQLTFARNQGNTAEVARLEDRQKTEIYKLSTDYQNFYAAIEAMSIESAQRVSDRIRSMLTENFRLGNLTAKQYQQEIKRLESQMDKLYQKQPTIVSMGQGGGLEVMRQQQKEAEAEAIKNSIELERINAEIAETQRAINTAKGQGNIVESQNLRTNLQALMALRDQKQANMDNTKVLSDNLKKMIKNREAAIAVLGVLENWSGSIISSISSVSTMIDSLGGDSSGMSDAMGAITDISSAAFEIGKGIASQDPVKIATSVIGGVSKVITGFAQRHDAKLQKRIEQMELDVKKLSNIYSVLETQMEHSLGVDSGLAEAQVKNLKEQLRLQEQMMEAEDAKKKTDQGKMEDYRQAIEEIRQQIKYYTEEMANDLYGIDVKAWAQEIGDAIVEAWSKGESAAKAYETTVADIMKNVVKNYLQKQVIENMLKNVQTTLFGSDGQGGLFGDGVFDENDVKQLGAVISSSGAAIAESTKMLDQLEAALNMYGISLKDTEETSEGISNAVEGVTEDTANQLVGYLNGMRAEMIVQSNLLRQIVLLNGGGTEGESGPSLQMLQLEALRQQLASINAIRDALTSVIAISPTGGSAIRAIITN